MKPFGAYVHARPDGSIFYVGKGKESRARNLRRNNHHANIVKKHGAETILIGFVECSSEAIAFELEKGLIKCLRRMNVALTNQTDGGEGLSNPSDETRSKIRSALTGHGVSAESRAKMRRAQLGKKATEATRAKNRAASIGRRHTDEARAKISSAHKGRKHTTAARANMAKAQLGSVKPDAFKAKMHMVLLGNQRRNGTKHSEATRAKMSASHLGHSVSVETRIKIGKSNTGKVRAPVKPETRKKLSVAALGKPRLDLIGSTRPEKVRAKISATLKGISRSPETRLKMSEAAKQRWANRKAK